MSIRNAWLSEKPQQVLHPQEIEEQPCERPEEHTLFFSWHMASGKALCGFCNPSLANAEGRYVLEYLHPEAQDALLSLIAREGLVLEDYLLFPCDTSEVEWFRKRLVFHQEQQRRVHHPAAA